MPAADLTIIGTEPVSTQDFVGGGRSNAVSNGFSQTNPLPDGALGPDEFTNVIASGYITAGQYIFSSDSVGALAGIYAYSNNTANYMLMDYAAITKSVSGGIINTNGDALWLTVLGADIQSGVTGPTTVDWSDTTDINWADLTTINAPNLSSITLDDNVVITTDGNLSLRFNSVQIYGVDTFNGGEIHLNDPPAIGTLGDLDIEGMAVSGVDCWGFYSQDPLYMNFAGFTLEAGITANTVEIKESTTLALTSITTLTATSAAASLASLSLSGSLIAESATATPAGGNANAFAFKVGTAALGFYFGSGAPTLTAEKGSLYGRTDGSGTNDRLYVATDNAGAWTAVVTVA